MTAYFVSSASGAGGAGNGSSWANAYLTLAACLARPIVAGTDNVFVGDDHTEFTSTTNLNFNFPGFSTTSTPNHLWVVDHTKASPTSADLKTGTATGGMVSGDANVIFNGNGHIYGLYVICAIGNSTTTGAILTQSANTFLFENCSFVNRGTNALQRIFQAAGSAYQEFKNCVFSCENAAQSPIVSGWKKLINCTFLFAGGSPSQLFLPSLTNSNLIFEGCDFSAFSGTTLASSNSNGNMLFIFKDCKLPAITGLFTVAAALRPQQNSIYVINCDSGATNYKNDLYDYCGELHTVASVFRTSGASQGTPYSWLVTTNANNLWHFQFKLLPLSIWNVTTGAAVNVAVEGIADPRDFSALPNNDDVWFDVEALENTSYPTGTYHRNTKPSPLGGATALTASTVAWDCTTLRANSTAYSVGDIRKVASNAGRLFVCTIAGTSASSEPGGYATAIDGGTVTDGGATFKAMWRFKQTVATGTVRLAGLITVYPNVGKASLNGIYIDPMITLS